MTENNDSIRRRCPQYESQELRHIHLIVFHSVRQHIQGKQEHLSRKEVPPFQDISQSKLKVAIQTQQSIICMFSKVLKSFYLIPPVNRCLLSTMLHAKINLGIKYKSQVFKKQ